MAGMTLSFNLSKAHLERGAHAHYNYRHKLRRVLDPVLGMIFMLYGGYMIWSSSTATSGAIGDTLGIVLIVCGTIMVMRKWIYAKKAASGALKGRDEGQRLDFSPDENCMRVKAPNGESRNDWISFVDFHFCDQGLLLYPTKQIFHWIPSSAEIEGGNWEEFEKLISRSIERRV